MDKLECMDNWSIVFGPTGLFVSLNVSVALFWPYFGGALSAPHPLPQAKVVIYQPKSRKG